MRTGLRDTAENLVKQQLVLDAIQAQENLSATEDQKDKLAVMNYFKNAAQMTATYGEDSSNQIFDMGAVYYYLIDNSTYVEAPGDYCRDNGSREYLRRSRDCCRGKRKQYGSKIIWTGNGPAILQSAEQRY